MKKIFNNEINENNIKSFVNTKNNNAFIKLGALLERQFKEKNILTRYF